MEDWNGLWSLLVRITLNKCGHQIAAFSAECRDVRCEAGPPDSGGASGREWTAIVREPTPQEAASLAETVENLMLALPERHREILSLRLEGFTSLEISRQIGRTERTVECLLQQVREAFQRLEKQGLASP